MKKIIVLITAVIYSISLTAQERTVFFKVDGLMYEITSANEVTGYCPQRSRKNAKEVVIPSSVKYRGNTYKVTSISREAFYSCSSLQNITIPSSVTSIGDEAFSECRSLQSITIPSSVTSIGKSAFAGCSSLQNITIPSSVTSIGDKAFHSCSSLQNITIPSSVTSIGGSAFARCSSLQNITIPSSVTSIGKSAFAGCSSLQNITIPSSVTSIGEWAFSECKSLQNITIPSSVTSIGEWAFSECKSLQNITIPSSVTSIGEWAFSDCKSLSNVRGLHSGIMYGIYVFNNTLFDFGTYQNSFEYSLNSYVIPKIKEWQKKRDFETTAQYQARVTKENQQKKIKELSQEAIDVYVGSHKLKISLGDYDADYQMYALNSNYGKKYVKIPLSEAPSFKSNFSQATFDATYMITNDGLQVNDLAISLNGRQYQAERTAFEIASNGIDIDLPEIILSQSDGSQMASTLPSKTIDSTIDKNIPIGLTNNKQTFAVIVGNERYTQVAQVPYANNDARIFAEYCKKTLGLPAKNVKVYENATYGTMIGAVSDIQKIARAFKGDISVIFYYAGHGIPDEATGDGYLLPIDADGMNMRVCYPLSQLYKDLSSMQARSVTCFMDACFSGAQRGSGMVVAARGVTIKAKNDHPTGNTVVFTAATDKQTAYPYEEKGHGMFTYYLLKKLRDTKGDCTLGELGTYICDEVAKQAVITNGKEQTPVVLTSGGVADSWKTMKLK